MEEENTEIQEDLGNGGKFKNWLQDNIRIILSVLIVATIAAGIYSYSKRTVVSTTGDEDAKVEVAKVDDSKSKDAEDNNSVVVVGEDKADNKTEKADNKDTEKLSVNQEADSQDKKTEEKKVEEKKEEVKQPAVEQKQDSQPEKAEQQNEKKEKIVSGEETNDAFVETAQKGDSLTLLARQAVKQYLEKNPVDGLTKEHKIYMEDYLRKHVGRSARINPGEQVSFSKDLIKSAVDSAQKLNANQLKNLQKYSARVSNL